MQSPSSQAQHQKQREAATADEGNDDQIPALQAFTESVKEEITGDNDALIVHGSQESKKMTPRTQSESTTEVNQFASSGG